MRVAIWNAGQEGIVNLKEYWVKEWLSMCSPWSANAMHIKLWLDLPTEDLRKFIKVQADMCRWDTCKSFAVLGTLILRREPEAITWRRNFIWSTIQDVCKQLRLEDNFKELVGDFENMET